MIPKSGSEKNISDNSDMDWMVYQSVVQFIRQTDSIYLPSIREMAKNFHVRASKVQSVIRQLQKEGRILTKPRGKIRIIGKKASIPTRSESAVIEFANAMKIQVYEGKFTAGENFPKRQFLKTQWKISDRTITKAFQYLQQLGFAHKSGKNWVVGSKAHSIRGEKDVSQGNLLLLLPFGYSWKSLNTPRHSGFARSFETEANRMGARLVPAILTESTSYPRIKLTGKNAIHQYIKQEDHSGLRGVLAVGMREEMESWYSLFTLIQKNKIPLVWFNRKADGPDSEAKKSGAVLCRFSEEAFLQSGCEWIRDHGHTRCGYLYYYSPFFAQPVPEWEQNRLTQIRCHLGNEFVFLFDDLEKELRTDTVQSLATRLRTMWNMRGRYQKILRYIYHNNQSIDFKQLAKIIQENLTLWRKNELIPGHWRDLPELIPLLLKPDCSLIICSNDTVAKRALAKLCQIGISIPDEISILSFDNYMNPVELPISTVDWGGEGLGYRSFHYLWGDLPIRLSRQMEIIAQPKVVPRGSINYLKR